MISSLIMAFALATSSEVSPCSGQEGLRRYLAVEGAGFQISLDRVEQTDYGGRGFHIAVESSKNPVSTFLLENMTTSVQRLDIFNSKLIIYGQVQNSASGVNIIDLRQMKEIDFLLARHPKRSSTGRYIIYKKFFPRMGLREAQSDLVLIYDLSAAPRKNRIGGADSPVGERPGSPNHLLASQNVGWPGYPLSYAQERTYRV